MVNDCWNHHLFWKPLRFSAFWHKDDWCCHSGRRNSFSHFMVFITRAFMSEIKSVILKLGKEKALINRHHWIFSGAIEKWPKHCDGDVLHVLSHDRQFLGLAYFNKKAAIAGRMLAFEEMDPEEAIVKNLKQACSLRESMFDEETNAYRVVNSEGDLLPGLVVDRYKNVFVLQISTLGMQKFAPIVVEFFKNRYQPCSILEKSMGPARKEEGLEPVQRTLFGEKIEEIIVKENGLNMAVRPFDGQKTGFFIDHREMRLWIRELAKGRKVLNNFSYSGGFSINALKGKATHVVSVDISKQAIELAKKNVVLNDLDMSRCHFYAEDVFQFLREHPLNYDLVILDPPAFAKKAKDIISACRGYKDINRIAMQKMPPKSLLLSCSCSYYIEEELFQKVLFQAAVEAKRTVKIIGRHRQAMDHPINICHKESDYLKSFLLYIE
ncbi:Ribosomal RNA large subunit methyltransferase I [Chlamydiales bacterium STE3]|nr:Ribosomal RNA large subunit methyltransferase I [Chlamydiales bacterium STE3]